MPETQRDNIPRAPRTRQQTVADDRRRRRAAGAVPVVVATALLVAAALMLWSQEHVPPAKPASAAASAFSAGRAIGDVAAIATRTRFLGSPGHDAARAYIVAELRGLGLRPQLQRTAVVNTFTGSDEAEAGTVTNVIARLPGAASTGAVALNAHYDSGPGGPGASDCASCVATVLEAARALRAGPRLRNDMIFVFSDGEENGDLGAAAFAAQHPWMRDVKAALNWETAGSHGPSMLLAGNSSSLVSEILAAAPNARSYSVLPSLFRGALKAQQLATDTQEYMDRGAAGAQFVHLRGTTNYHTRLDDLAHLGRGSLQMGGDYAVSAARRLGGRRLTRQVGDRATYFNITGGIIVQYGAAVTLLLGLLAAGLFVACVVVGLRRRVLTVRGLALGTLAFPVAVALSTLGSVLIWLALKAQVADLRVFTVGTSQNGFFVFGLLAFALAVFTALYAPMLRRARAENLALGALAWWLALTVTFAVVAPSAAYLFAWPTLAALAVTAWWLAGARPPGWQTAAGVAVPLAVLVVVYAPVMLVFTVLALRLDGLGLPVVGAMGLFASLAAGLLVPHLGPRLRSGPGRVAGRGLLPGVAGLTAVALIGLGVARLGYDADNPRPDVVAYVYDADRGRATWQAADRTSWTASLLADATKTDIELAPFATVSGWSAPASSVDLAPPRVSQESRTVTGDATTLRLRLSSPRGADALSLNVRAAGPIGAARVEGRALPDSAALRRGEIKLPYVGLPQRGIELTLTVRRRGRLEVTLHDWTQGLPPQAGAPARPADTMPAAISFRADPTVVTHTERIDL